MVTHSSILAWRIPWTEEPWGRKESDTERALMYPKPQRWGSNPVGILIRRDSGQCLLSLPGENAYRRWPSASQEESSYQKPTLIWNC